MTSNDEKDRARALLIPYRKIGILLLSVAGSFGAAFGIGLIVSVIIDRAERLFLEMTLLGMGGLMATVIIFGVLRVLLDPNGARD